MSLVFTFCPLLTTSIVVKSLLLGAILPAVRSISEDRSGAELIMSMVCAFCALRASSADADALNASKKAMLATSVVRVN